MRVATATAQSFPEPCTSRIFPHFVAAGSKVEEGEGRRQGSQRDGDKIRSMSTGPITRPNSSPTSHLWIVQHCMYL